MQLTFEALNQPQDESSFRKRLAGMLRAEPFNHDVYFHDPDDSQRFTVHRAQGYPDLYILTSPDWSHHGIFPTVAVETKLPTDLKWVARNGIEQAIRYAKDKSAEFRIAGKVVASPTLVLLATPESIWGQEVLYLWHEPRYKTEREVWAASDGITQLCQRHLQEYGAAVMTGKGFYSNIVSADGKRGPMKRYELWT